MPYKTLGLTAIPIFVKRMFRHSYIYVNKRAGIRSPADLNGRRIGVQAWFTTAALWGRAILIDDYGLDFKSVHWVAHRQDSVGDWKQPDWLKLEYVPPGKTLHDMMAAGEIDAGITTETWAPDGHPDVDFLFPNYAELERDYYRRTGIFPIHHTLLIRTALLERAPLGSDEHVQGLGRIEAALLRVAEVAAGPPDLALVPRACGRRSRPPAARLLPLGLPPDAG